MASHADQEFLDIGAGNNLRLAGQIGLLTDANVTGATGVDDLKVLVDTNALGLHADQQFQVYNIKRALDLGRDVGVWTDAAVQAATSLENMASLTLANVGHFGPPVV